MTLECPPLELTFAGCLGRWRVVDKVREPGRVSKNRFAVMGTLMGAPADGPEVELCAVQYRPHAEAIAALPELVNVVLDAQKDCIAADSFQMSARARQLLNLDRDTVAAAIAKAEGRAG